MSPTQGTDWAKVSSPLPLYHLNPHLCGKAFFGRGNDGHRVDNVACSLCDLQRLQRLPLIRACNRQCCLQMCEQPYGNIELLRAKRTAPLDLAAALSSRPPPKSHRSTKPSARLQGHSQAGQHHCLAVPRQSVPHQLHAASEVHGACG